MHTSQLETICRAARKALQSGQLDPAGRDRAEAVLRHAERLEAEVLQLRSVESSPSEPSTS